MTRFTKKTVTIDAILAGEVLDGATDGRFSAKAAIEDRVPAWIIAAFEQGVIGFELDAVLVNTHHGQARAERADWIIRGVDGELYPCKADVFAKTYDEGDGAQVITIKGDLPPEQFKAFREKWNREVSSYVSRAPLLDADLFEGDVERRRRVDDLYDQLDIAWGLIANAGNGDWKTQTPEWVAAAERWRDRYATPTMHDAPKAPSLTEQGKAWAEEWNKKVERIHAQEKVAVESGWVELKDQPPPKRRDDLRPAWEEVIEEFKQRYCIGDYLTDASSAAVVRDVLDDMTARDVTGRERYGVPLTAFNGRDQLVDAYQEALDLAVYLRAAQDEGITGASAVYSNTLHNIFWLRVAINSRTARAA